MTTKKIICQVSQNITGLNKPGDIIDYQLTIENNSHHKTLIGPFTIYDSSGLVLAMDLGQLAPKTSASAQYSCPLSQAEFQAGAIVKQIYVTVNWNNKTYKTSTYQQTIATVQGI